MEVIDNIVRGLSEYTLTTVSVAPNFDQIKFNQSTCFFTDNSLFDCPADSIYIGITDTYIGITYYALYTLKNEQLYVPNLTRAVSVEALPELLAK